MQNNTLGQRTQQKKPPCFSISEKALNHRIRTVTVARNFTHQLDVDIDQTGRHFEDSL